MNCVVHLFILTLLSMIENRVFLLAFYTTVLLFGDSFFFFRSSLADLIQIFMGYVFCRYTLIISSFVAWSLITNYS